MVKLAGLFAVTALLYAAVGFGGGSTYNALLVLAGTDYQILPSIALVCNIIVVTGGTIAFHKSGLIPWRNVWPLFALSVPMAWLGGRIPVAEIWFVLVLGLALLSAGLLMLFQSRRSELVFHEKRLGIGIPVLGAGLGLISGMVGIGGGIFLAPVLHLIGWGRAKVISGVCSAFILVNSAAGLLGQIMRLGGTAKFEAMTAYWPLFIAVLIGGQIGSRAGTRWLDPQIIRMLTALLILFVAVRLLWRSANSFGII